MDSKDKIWIAVAGAVAVASMALSVVIVRFSPDDPYAARTRVAAQTDIRDVRAAMPDAHGREGASSRAVPVNPYPIVRRDSTLGVNVLCAAVGVVFTLSSLFAFFAWDDRRTIWRGDASTGLRHAFETAIDPTSASGRAACVERRRTERRHNRCDRDMALERTLERRREHRRIVDSVIESIAPEAR
jgi:hypothetical protein